jgi:DNA polymerase-3 subunit beta
VIKPDSIILVATDGHRLALVESKHDSGVSQEIGVILPKKTLLELGKLLGEGEGDLQFEAGENHLFFDVERAASSFHG